jgi:hypothetical protein
MAGVTVRAFNRMCVMISEHFYYYLHFSNTYEPLARRYLSADDARQMGTSYQNMSGMHFFMRLQRWMDTPRTAPAYSLVHIDGMTKPRLLLRSQVSDPNHWYFFGHDPESWLNVDRPVGRYLPVVLSWDDVHFRFDTLNVPMSPSHLLHCNGFQVLDT